MADSSVRLLTPEEKPEGARIVCRQMLADDGDEATRGWAELWGTDPTHGAFAGDDLVGTCHWFPTQLSLPGTPVPAAGVTAVSVLSTHRRQGHLSRLMAAQLRSAADAGNPAAVLIAAEWPIYGRFGYGPATEACVVQLDTGAARFRAAPTGRATMVDLAELRPALEQAHGFVWARSPGAIVRRDGHYWDFAAGLRATPGSTLDVKHHRGVVWHDDAGHFGGAAIYKVEEQWVANRPAGTVVVEHLYGATPEAERELWRHLCTIDWCRTAKAPGRAVDDPLPLWLEDARAATLVDRSDNVWLRLLDLPALCAARTSPVAGSAVLEIDDPLGYVDGRWLVELGPDGGSATPTTAMAELALSASTLGAAFLGGHTLARLARAGLVQEEHLGSLPRISALFATAAAPWSPLDF